MWLLRLVPAVLLLAWLAGLGIARMNDVPSSVDPAADSFVTRAGSEFTVAGEPYAFVGFNLYDAAATVRYRCAPWPRWSDAQLDEAFAYMHDEAGARVLRFWAYQTYTAAGTDWSGVDRVIRLARKHGMRVLPVLEDGPGNCTTGTNGQKKEWYEGDTWYTSGYRHPYGNAVLSYRDYVAKIVAHYRDNPTIFGWSMMNEAETKTRDAAGKSALVGFANDVGHLIKALDPNHLVTVGTQGDGAPGGSGQDFADIYSLPSIDFAEVHDWAFYGSDTDPMPGSVGGQLPDAGSPMCAGRDGTKIACSFAIASEVLHKPIVVGEAGIAVKAGDLQTRANLLDAKMTSAFAIGHASGYLIWQFNKVLDGGGYDVLQRQDDPLVRSMQSVSKALP